MKAPPDEQVTAGAIARESIQLGMALCRDGIDGVRLDKEIEEYIRDSGGVPALKGYLPRFSQEPYQYTICLSLNNEAVHGVPVKFVAPSHLITIDLVVEFKGWHADTARTFTHGDDPIKKQFAKASKLILDTSLDAIGPQQSISLFSTMVEMATKTSGYAVIKEFCGHGIGRTIHAEPQVLNYHTLATEVFEVGKAFAVEPVLTIEPTYELSKGKDGWTINADCLSSHNEDTVFISEAGAINLTGEQDE